MCLHICHILPLCKGEWFYLARDVHVAVCVAIRRVVHIGSHITDLARGVWRLKIKFEESASGNGNLGQFSSHRKEVQDYDLTFGVRISIIECKPARNWAKCCTTWIHSVDSSLDMP